MPSANGDKCKKCWLFHHKTRCRFCCSGSKLDSGMFEASDSSIYYLSTQVNVTFEELLRGNQSFGGFLEDNGFVAIPSPMNPGRNGNSYFSGGYNTKRYGSRDSGMIDAIQIESSADQRSNEARPEYAKALAKTVKAYLETYYSDLLKATDEATTMSDNDNETSEAVTEAGNTGTQLNQFWVASFLCLCLSFTLHVVT